MRLVIRIVMLAVLAWCTWWALAVFWLGHGIEGWFAARRAEGWQADYADLTRSGFPDRLHVTLDLPALADPETGVAIDARRLDIGARAVWPGDVVITLPEDPIVLANPWGRSFLTLPGRAELRTHPSNDLELEHLSLKSGPWKLDDPDGNLVSADDLAVVMQQSETAAQVYEIGLNANGFRPGELTRKRFFVPEDWPVAFDRFTLEATVRFDRPWDRKALEDSRPQPREISLSLAEAAWGDLRLKAAADLDVDEQGIPTGELKLQARNWREILALAEAAGALSTDFRPQVEKILGTLASLAGNPDNFDVTLTFEDGRMSMGFLPLGPAPHIYLR